MIAYHAWVQETVVTLLLNVVMLRDPEEWAKSVANDERAFARAITFSNIIVLNFGCEPYADKRRVLSGGAAPSRAASIYRATLKL